MAENKIPDIDTFYEITKQSILAEQERARLEEQRLEEEKLRRAAEEGRVRALKLLTEKIDILLQVVSEIKPTVDIMARNGDTIAEILRVLAGSIPHMAEKDLEILNGHITSVIAAQNSRFNANPVNVHVGTNFNSDKDLNINTQGDQKIG